MTGATKRPWAVSHTDWIIPAAHLDRKIGWADDPKCDRDDYAQIIFHAPDDRHGRGDAAAHIALTVRAVNAHDALVEALEMVRDADKDCHRDSLKTMPAPARAKIDAALALAKEDAP